MKFGRIRFVTVIISGSACFSLAAIWRMRRFRFSDEIIVICYSIDLNTIIARSIFHQKQTPAAPTFFMLKDSPDCHAFPGDVKLRADFGLNNIFRGWLRYGPGFDIDYRFDAFRIVLWFNFERWALMGLDRHMMISDISLRLFRWL